MDAPTMIGSEMSNTIMRAVNEVVSGTKFVGGHKT